jgi:hypothetical protein
VTRSEEFRVAFRPTAHVAWTQSLDGTRPVSHRSYFFEGFECVSSEEVNTILEAARPLRQDKLPAWLRVS